MSWFSRSQSSQSATTGGFFALGGSFFLNILSLIRGVLIARLLVPAEVGRFALVAAVLAGLETVTYPGLHDAVVQGPAPNERRLSVAWTVLVCRGVVLGAALFASAELVAGAFNRPDVAELLRWMSLLPLILSTVSMSLPLRRRNMDVRSVTLNSVWEAATNTVVSLVAAALLQSATALVIGALVGAAFKVLASYRLGTFRPRVSFALAEIRELLNFSRWRFMWGAVWYLSTQLDDLVIGRALGMRSLGYYKIAYRIGYFPSTASTAALAQVAFPAIALKFREGDRAVETYSRYVLLVASFAIPMGLYLAAMAEPLVLLLVGPAWLATVTPIAIIGIAAGIRSLTATGSALFLAAGRPGLDTAMETARALALGVGLLLIMRFELVGAALAVLISNLAAVPVWLGGCRSIGGEASHLLPILKRLPLAAIPAIVATPLAAGLAPALGLIVSAPLGFGLYVLITKRYDHELWQEWARVARSLRQTKPFNRS